MNDESRARRFIAGTVCPHCGAKDTLYFTDDTNREFACIDCKHRRTETSMPSNGEAKETVPIKIIDKR